MLITYHMTKVNLHHSASVLVDPPLCKGCLRREISALHQSKYLQAALKGIGLTETVGQKAEVCGFEYVLVLPAS